MTAANFALSLPLTLVYEGGKADDPRDPGGRTNQGVTQRVYTAWRVAQGLPDRDVWQMTGAERDAIYRSRYWQQAGCNELPAGLDYAVFDFAVNSGVGRSVKTLQSMVGAVADGVIGPNTMQRVMIYRAVHGPVGAIDDLCTARLRFLRALPGFATYGKGWTRRVMGTYAGPQSGDTGVVDRAADMATAHVPTAPVAPLVTRKTYLAAAA